MKVTDEKRALVTALQTKFGNVVTRQQVIGYVKDAGLDHPSWLFNNKAFRAGRGQYDLTKVVGAGAPATVQATV